MFKTWYQIFAFILHRFNQINNLKTMTKLKAIISFLLYIFNFVNCQYSEYFINYSVQRQGVFLYEFFYDVQDGFYVDIGAYDPIFASNTLNLYTMGWNGINIDANPERLSRFFYSRPGQPNLNYAIGDEDQFVTLYQLAEDSSSTVSPKVKQHVKNYKPVRGQIQVPSITMKELCERFFYRRPLFLNLDIQGYGSKALMTNDWNNTNCKPDIIFSQINQQTRISGLPLPQTILQANGYKKWTNSTGLNEIYILSQVYDKYVSKQKQGEKLMRTKQEMNIQFIANQLAAHKKVRTTLVTHHDPTNDDIHYHFARFKQVVNLNDINKFSNKISNKQDRPICIFNFDVDHSYLLLNNQNYSSAVVKMNNYVFTQITVFKGDGTNYEAYVFDHSLKGQQRPKILISGVESSQIPTKNILKSSNFTFENISKDEAGEANKQVLSSIENQIKNYSSLINKIRQELESQHKQLLDLLNKHYRDRQEVQVIVSKVVQIESLDKTLRQQFSSRNGGSELADARKQLGPLIQNQILMLFAVFFSYIITLVILCMMRPEGKVVIYNEPEQEITGVDYIRSKPQISREQNQEAVQ